MAIRFGQRLDSSVVATKLGKSLRYVVATADYLKGRRLPTEPEELRSYDCVMFNANNCETDWDLISGRKKVRVHVTGVVSSRDCQSVAAFVLRGQGVGLVETAHCDQALANSDLVRLLPRWTSTEMPVYAVYPSRKYLPPRMTVFLKALESWKNTLWVSA